MNVTIPLYRESEIACNSIRKAILSVFEPVIAGNLDPGIDLDILIVLGHSGISLDQYERCIRLISETCSKIEPHIVLYQRFVDRPRLIVQENAQTPILPVHLHIYPDICSLLKWEKHWIIASIIKHLRAWSESQKSCQKLLNRLNPEVFQARFSWYRQLVAEGVFGASSSGKRTWDVASDLANRTQYSLKYALVDLDMFFESECRRQTNRDKSIRKELHKTYSELEYLAVDLQRIEFEVVPQIRAALKVGDLLASVERLVGK